MVSSSSSSSSSYSPFNVTYKVGWNERKGKQRGRFWLQGIRVSLFIHKMRRRKKKKKTLTYQEDKKRGVEAPCSSSSSSRV